jgi:hypothetical protein
MFNNQKIVVVIPADNVARTVRRTYDEVMVDLVIVVDAKLRGVASCLA